MLGRGINERIQINERRENKLRAVNKAEDGGNKQEEKENMGRNGEINKRKE